jgi:hypothetical protein
VFLDKLFSDKLFSDKLFSDKLFLENWNVQAVFDQNGKSDILKSPISSEKIPILSIHSKLPLSF